MPDEVVIARAVGLRYDPVANRIYHLKYDPPPKNSSIEGRLIRKASDTEQATKARLAIYRKNVKGIVSTFANTIKILTYPDGIMGSEEVVYKDVFNILGQRPISRAPRSFKVIIAGLPGSGKTKIAEMMQSKFGFVHGMCYILWH